MQIIRVLMQFKTFCGVQIQFDENWIYRIEPIFECEQKCSLESVGCGDEHLKNVVEFLRSYESGTFFNPEISNFRLKFSCSEFALSVYKALSEVPAGVFVRYGELASNSGHPCAARAVGHAMHCNPFPILIPCHRVISGRNMWLYAFGEAMKRELMAHEGLLIL